jgi:hypothetical protein
MLRALRSPRLRLTETNDHFPFFAGDTVRQFQTLLPRLSNQRPALQMSFATLKERQA